MCKVDSGISSNPDYSKFIKGMRRAIGLEAAGEEADECLEIFKRLMSKLVYED